MLGAGSEPSAIPLRSSRPTAEPYDGPQRARAGHRQAALDVGLAIVLPPCRLPPLAGNPRFHDRGTSRASWRASTRMREGRRRAHGVSVARGPPLGAPQATRPVWPDGDSGYVEHDHGSPRHVHALHREERSVATCRAQQPVPAEKIFFFFRAAGTQPASRARRDVVHAIPRRRARTSPCSPTQARQSSHLFTTTAGNPRRRTHSRRLAYATAGACPTGDRVGLAGSQTRPLRRSQTKLETESTRTGNERRAMRPTTATCGQRWIATASPAYALEGGERSPSTHHPTCAVRRP